MNQLSPRTRNYLMQSTLTLYYLICVLTSSPILTSPIHVDQVGEIKRKLHLSGLLTPSGSTSGSVGGSSSGSGSSGSGNANSSAGISATNYLPGLASTAGGNVSMPGPQGGAGAPRDPATTLDIEVRNLAIIVKD